MNAICSDQSVHAAICQPSELKSSERDAMMVLMRRYYRNVKEATFIDDLDSKDFVICLRTSTARAAAPKGNEPDRLVGFSTQKIGFDEVTGSPVRVLFSGDTIVEREHRNSPHLARAWGRLALRLTDESTDPLYWLLLSKGYRTYRFLPLFFRRYAPTTRTGDVEELDRIRQVLMQRMYGTAFDPETFIVSGQAIDNYSVRDGIADIERERRNDPHIRFFSDSNPGYGDGDELCCIARLCRDNFTAAARRVIGTEYF